MSGRQSISSSFVVTTLEDGIVYDIQLPVDSLHIASGQSSATLSGTVKFYVKEGSKAKAQTAFYYAVYKRTGTSFTTVATGSANSYTFSSLSVANTVDAVSVYLLSSSYTSTSPESQTYLAKKEIAVVKDGAKGTSAWNAYISNGMDSVACDVSGTPTTTQTVSAGVSLYYGATKKQFSVGVYKNEACTTAYTNSSTPSSGIAVWWTSGNADTNTINVKLTTAYVFDSDTSKLNVYIKLTSYDDSSVTRVLTFTVNGIRPGDDGNDGVAYSVQAIPGMIAIPANTSSMTVQLSNFTFKAYKNVGGTTSAYSCFFKLFTLSGQTYTAVTSSDSSPATSTWNYLTGTVTVTSSTNAFVCCIYSSDATYASHANYLAEIVVPVVKYGDTGGQGDLGPIFYPAGVWTSGVSYTRTDSLCPYVEYEGSYYYPASNGTPSTSTAPPTYQWLEATHLGMVLTDAVFSPFGKLGSSVFDEDYQFSQYGYMVGLNGTRTTINNSYYYTEIDPNDVFGMVVPETIIDFDGEVEIYNTSWNDPYYVSFAWQSDYTAGYYSVEITGYRQKDGPSLEWRVRVENSSTILASGSITATSQLTQSSNFMLAGLSNGQEVMLEMIKSGSGDEPVHISSAFAKCKFVPQAAVNWKAGSAMMEDLYVRGTFMQNVMEITPSNYTRFCYTPLGFGNTDGYNGGPLFIDLTKCGPLVRITGTWSHRPPSVFAPDFYNSDESQRDRIRGLAGKIITIINNAERTNQTTGWDIYIKSSGCLKNYYKSSTTESLTKSRTLGKGKVCMLDCMYGLNETWVGNTSVTYSDESVRWRIRVQGGSEGSLSTSARFSRWDSIATVNTQEMAQIEQAQYDYDHGKTIAY